MVVLEERQKESEAGTKGGGNKREEGREGAVRHCCLTMTALTGIVSAAKTKHRARVWGCAIKGTQ